MANTRIKKEFLDESLADESQLNDYVLKAGDTMTGDLHMSEQKVINIADGTDPRDAVNLQQLNAAIPDPGDFLAVANNLSDLANAATARTNLGAQAKMHVTVGLVGTMADYICDGVADEVEHNQAIQDVGAAGGGIVESLAGTYNMAGTVVNDQVGVLVRGQVVAHFAKVTYWKASGTYSTFATIANTSAGGFEDIYMDGNNTVTDGLVIGTSSTTTKVKNPIVRNLRIEKFSGKAISGTGTPASGAWDDVVFYNIRIASCSVGLENHSTKTTIIGSTLAACTNAFVALLSSSADFFGTVFSTNTRDFDIQTTQSTGNYGFHSTYHESATNSILGRSVAPSGADTVGGFTFTGCFFQNQSAAGSGFALDFTNMGCTVQLNNCSYDVAAGASRTINVGTNTKVIVIGKGLGNTPLFTGTTSNVTYLGDLKLGIGKASPDSPLHVYQDDSGVGQNNGIVIEQDGAGDALLQYILTGTRRWVAGVDNSDGDKYKISATLDLANAIFTLDTSGNIVTPGDISVADEVYGVGWNGSLEVPTKNAVYDKIETLGGGAAWGGITGTLSAQTDLQTALDTKANNATLAASGMGVVVHGATAGTARPTGYAQITWVGSVEPTNALDNDVWVDTA